MFATVALATSRCVPQRFPDGGAFKVSARPYFGERQVPGKVVAQLMGHANVDTTLNVYTQVLDGSVRAAVEKIGDELFTIVHRPEKADAVTD